jgi:hypothetical protein
MNQHADFVTINWWFYITNIEGDSAEGSYYAEPDVITNTTRLNDRSFGWSGGKR